MDKVYLPAAATDLRKAFQHPFFCCLLLTAKVTCEEATCLRIWAHGSHFEEYSMRVGSKKRRSKIEMVHRIDTILYAYPTFLIPPPLKSTSASRKSMHKILKKSTWVSTSKNYMKHLRPIYKALKCSWFCE